MNQELKQRLIGAVVITALAAIFIPMLFDDPVDNSGQIVSEMAIPEAPVNAAGDTADKLPANADDILKKPDDQEPSLPEESGDIAGNTDTNAGEEAEQGVNEPENARRKSIPDQEASIAPSKGEVLGDTTESTNEEEEAQPPITQHKNNPPKQVVSSEPLENDIVEEVKKPVKAKKAVIAPKKPSPNQVALLKPMESGPIAAIKKPGSVPKVNSPKPVHELVRWYLQAGSFAKKENALLLWESIRKQGLPVLLETIQVAEKGALYRLKVGPELDKDRAIAMKAKLDKQNIKTILVSE
ncbi:MAG: SPOR domain-containing protein [Methylobacter sp.]|nr:SPOR domain-containing protein [Methylobacter sp.]